MVIHKRLHKMWPDAPERRWTAVCSPFVQRKRSAQAWADVTCKNCLTHRAGAA